MRRVPFQRVTTPDAPIAPTSTTPAIPVPTLLVRVDGLQLGRGARACTPGTGAPRSPPPRARRRGDAGVRRRRARRPAAQRAQQRQRHLPRRRWPGRGGGERRDRHAGRQRARRPQGPRRRARPRAAPTKTTSAACGGWHRPARGLSAGRYRWRIWPTSASTIPASRTPSPGTGGGPPGCACGGTGLHVAALRYGTAGPRVPLPAELARSSDFLDARRDATVPLCVCAGVVTRPALSAVLAVDPRRDARCRLPGGRRGARRPGRPTGARRPPARPAGGPLRRAGRPARRHRRGRRHQAHVAGASGELGRVARRPLGAGLPGATTRS